MVFFVQPEFVEHRPQVPLLQVASLVSRVQDLGLGVEVHASDREVNWFLACNGSPVGSHDLLALIEEDLPTEERVLVGAWHHCVEVQVALSVSRHQAVVSF